MILYLNSGELRDQLAPMGSRIMNVLNGQRLKASVHACCLSAELRPWLVSSAESS